MEKVKAVAWDSVIELNCEVFLIAHRGCNYCFFITKSKIPTQYAVNPAAAGADRNLAPTPFAGSGAAADTGGWLRRQLGQGVRKHLPP